MTEKLVCRGLCEKHIVILFRLFESQRRPLTVTSSSSNKTQEQNPKARPVGTNISFLGKGVNRSHK